MKVTPIVPIQALRNQKQKKQQTKADFKSYIPPKNGA